MIIVHKSLKNEEMVLFYINKSLKYYPNSKDIVQLKNEIESE